MTLSTPGICRWQALADVAVDPARLDDRAADAHGSDVGSPVSFSGMPEGMQPDSLRWSRMGSGIARTVLTIKGYGVHGHRHGRAAGSTAVRIGYAVCRPGGRVNPVLIRRSVSPWCLLR